MRKKNCNTVVLAGGGDNRALKGGQSNVTRTSKIESHNVRNGTKIKPILKPRMLEQGNKSKRQSLSRDRSKTPRRQTMAAICTYEFDNDYINLIIKNSPFTIVRSNSLEELP